MAGSRGRTGSAREILRAVRSWPENLFRDEVRFCSFPLPSFFPPLSPCPLPHTFHNQVIARGCGYQKKTTIHRKIPAPPPSKSPQPIILTNKTPTTASHGRNSTSPPPPCSAVSTSSSTPMSIAAATWMSQGIASWAKRRVGVGGLGLGLERGWSRLVKKGVGGREGKCKFCALCILWVFFVAVDG